MTQRHWYGVRAPDINPPDPPTPAPSPNPPTGPAGDIPTGIGPRPDNGAMPNPTNGGRYIYANRRGATANAGHSPATPTTLEHALHVLATPGDVVSYEGEWPHGIRLGGRNNPIRGTRQHPIRVAQETRDSASFTQPTSAIPFMIGNCENVVWDRLTCWGGRVAAAFGWAAAEKPLGPANILLRRPSFTDTGQAAVEFKHDSHIVCEDFVIARTGLSDTQPDFLGEGAYAFYNNADELDGTRGVKDPRYHYYRTHSEWPAQGTGTLLLRHGLIEDVMGGEAIDMKPISDLVACSRIVARRVQPTWSGAVVFGEDKGNTGRIKTLTDSAILDVRHDSRTGVPGVGAPNTNGHGLSMAGPGSATRVLIQAAGSAVRPFYQSKGDNRAKGNVCRQVVAVDCGEPSPLDPEISIVDCWDNRRDGDGWSRIDGTQPEWVDQIAGWRRYATHEFVGI